MTDFPELAFQAMLALMIITWLSFGGEKFESVYDPAKKWILGANWFKRGFAQKKGPTSTHVN